MSKGLRARVGRWASRHPLLVGTWEVETAKKEGIPYLAVLPCLLLTFVLGPIGFLAFLVARWTLGHRW